MERPLMMVIKDTHKLWADYMKSFAAEAGVPESYRMVLTFLLRNPGASQKDIAEHRRIKTASVSQIVKEMQQNGYVKKEANDQDQRYVKLYLTEKGEACANELRGKILRADEKITEFLSPEREQELIDAMNECSCTVRKQATENKR